MLHPCFFRLPRHMDGSASHSSPCRRLAVSAIPGSQIITRRRQALAPGAPRQTGQVKGGGWETREEKNMFARQLRGVGGAERERNALRKKDESPLASGDKASLLSPLSIRTAWRIWEPHVTDWTAPLTRPGGCQRSYSHRPGSCNTEQPKRRGGVDGQ